MSSPTLKTLAALMVAITAALITQPMRAGAIDSLVITEFSSTSLTAILNGTTSLSVTPGIADHWTIALTGVSSPAPFPGHVWFEPDGSGLFNEVAAFAPDQLSVVSDTFAIGIPSSANNTPDSTTFTLNGGLLSVTFNDLGDAAAAPDTGTTFSLFALSLMGLGFLRRKLRHLSA